MKTVLGIVVTWCLVALSVIDLDHHLLPDILTLPLMWTGLLASLTPVFIDVQSAVLGAAAGYLCLWLVFHVIKLTTGKDTIGFGDFKLLAAFGALLGWQQLPVILYYRLFNWLSGCIDITGLRSRPTLSLPVWPLTGNCRLANNALG